MTSYKSIFVLTFLFLIFSCGNDDDTVDMTDDTMPPVLSAEIEVYEANLLHGGLVLGIENGQSTAYLLNKEGQKLFTWTFTDRLGNDLELLNDGRVIGAFKVDNPPFTFGGGAGAAKIVNPDGSIDWEYILADNNFIIHHDVEMLPNGNILMLVWERIDVTTAQQAGINTTIDIFPEKLIEVNPTNDQIVWQWRAWDHLVQDTDSNLPNFGVISDMPQRIDPNYNVAEDVIGDIMHANGIDHDAVKDVIYISINFYSEVWVVDHSTTTQEAVTNTGGNYNKGGDLLYRFGNPSAYQNMSGERIFYNNHFPNLLEDGEPGSGNMLVYANNTDNMPQSTVFELAMPQTFTLTPNINNEPAVIWSFTDPDLYHSRVSGAVRLSNGNTLICEGDYGYWEITPAKEIAWKYNGMTNFWRGYGYDLDFTGLSNLGLTF